MSKKSIKQKLPYCGWYTVSFLMITIVILCICAISGKTLIWSKDGMAQHYPALIYIHQYMTDILKNLLHGTVSVPMVDYKIGQGMDVLTTLNYYGFGDPLMIFAVLCPVKYMEIMYGALIFLRLYLAGLFFSMFCFIKKQGRDASVLMGTLIFVFSGYGIYAGVRHPFFINGMMFLPLILIGIERAFQKKKYGFYAFVVGWSMMTNFYFTYMNTILMAIYILFRLVPYKKTSIKNKVKKIMRLMGAYFCGLMMTALVSVPVIIAYLNCSRSGEGGYRGSLLHYDAKFYLHFLGAYFFPALSVGNWTNLSFTILSFFALAILLFKKEKNKRHVKRNRLLKRAFIILTAMMLIPFAGKVMNGFGYVSNRWDYAYAMFIGYVVVCMMPRISDAVSFLIYRFKINSPDIRIRTVIDRAFCIITVCLVMFQSYFIYYQIDYLKEFVDIGTANDLLAQTPVQAVSGEKDGTQATGLERTEQPWYIGNQSIALNYYGHSWYFSIAPKLFCDYYNDFQMNSMERTYSFRGLDSRSMLNEIAATKYYVTNSMSDGLIPYGYFLQNTLKRSNGEIQYRYKNRYFIPVGYTVSQWIKEEEYHKLSPIEKQEALLQAAVLDEKEAEHTKLSSVNTSDLTLNSQESKCRITGMSGVRYENGRYITEEDNATIDVEFLSPPDCETYLYFNGIEALKSRSQYQTCSVSCGQSLNYFVLMTKEKTAWYNNPDITVNLGYSNEERKSCRITIPCKGEYRIDNISIISQPMKEYTSMVGKLKRDVLSDVKVSPNKISGNIKVLEEKLMHISVPYSTGWSAYIDGKKTDIIKADTMYMGINIPKGSHLIELRYKTPGIKAGVVISIMGICIFIVMINKHRFKRRA